MVIYTKKQNDLIYYDINDILNLINLTFIYDLNNLLSSYVVFFRFQLIIIRVD